MVELSSAKGCLAQIALLREYKICLSGAGGIGLVQTKGPPRWDSMKAFSSFNLK